MSEAPTHHSKPPPNTLKTTPLDSLHHQLDGRMAPFAGYSLPVQYAKGILHEHIHTRTQAGLFDVSHMGQARLWGANAAALFETLVCGDIQGLSHGAMRYTLLLNEHGGILDDLMVTQCGDHLFLVVNAACKDADFAHMEAALGGQARLERLEDRALLALQGPAAAAVLARFSAPVRHLRFMTSQTLTIAGVSCFVTRSGYTGEDGYEISVPVSAAETVAHLLLDEPEVNPIGLGARDSLRLEAGLCLYGSDMDATTTPVEASLSWAVAKRRRSEANFPGAGKILTQLAEGVARKRVGLRPEGKAPARAGCQIVDQTGATIGQVTSGGFGPTVGGPVAMGYVETAHAARGSRVALLVRGKPLPAEVVALPFVEQRYYRG